MQSVLVSQQRALPEMNAMHASTKTRLITDQSHQTHNILKANRTTKGQQNQSLHQAKKNIHQRKQIWPLK